MRALIAFAAALAAFAAHADTLEIYRSVDAQGHVTYTNVKPKHDGYDVVNVEFERQPAALAAPVAAASQVATPRGLPVVEAGKAVPAPVTATLRVVAFPSLRLAAAGEATMARRRKAPAMNPVLLRLDSELRSWSGQED